MPKITELFAFVAADKGADDEGIMAFCDLRTGIWTPMVGADLKRVESIRARADEIARISGKPYRVLRFKLVEEVQAPAKRDNPA